MIDKEDLGGLLDFSFTKFFTINVIKFLYMLCIALAAIGGLAILGSGFASRSALGIIGGIILAPIAFALYVIFARIWLELVVVAFNIANNTKRLVEIAECCEEEPCDDESCECDSSAPEAPAAEPQPAPEPKKEEDDRISL